MDNLGPQEPNHTPGELVQDQLDSLRQVQNIALILLLMLAGTFTLFIYQQFRFSQIDSRALRQIVDDYNQTNLPVIVDFRNRLQEYARTHPDFAPIAAKHGLVSAPAGQAPSLQGAPAGSLPTAPQKKR